jgi:hypothetical protein
MKRPLLLIPVAALTVTGCSAMRSLIIHPLQVIHANHENVEREQKIYRAEVATNDGIIEAVDPTANIIEVSNPHPVDLNPTNLVDFKNRKPD